MHRVAFRMQLHKGCEAEYERRHKALWPDLQQLLHESGIREYSIFLDEETNILFGVMNVEDDLKLNELPDYPVMKKWWTYMRDIMETNVDHSPISIPLKEVFYLP